MLWEIESLSRQTANVIAKPSLSHTKVYCHCETGRT